LRIAVISDIHANLHALDAVLAALEEDAPDAVWNLGDTVGYGPRPNECCAFAGDRAQLSLIGNHDLVALGSSDVDVEEFNPEAAAAAAWTRDALTEESRAFLQALLPSATTAGVELYHGSPRDPVWEYVLTVEAARAAFTTTEAPLVLVGHSHVPLALHLEGAEVVGGLATWPPAAGFSTPARSASLETATLGPRTACSTSTGGGRLSCAWSTRSTRRRPRCARRGCP
jgi:predicted phosphodiesterase